MYRAIRMFNGGEDQRFKHFDSLVEAYTWLIPSLQDQEDERWHIKLLPAIRQDMEERNFKIVTVGFNEMQNSRECTLYIQIVKDYQDDTPKF